MSKLAALATVLALVATVPTAAAYDLPLGATYDLPADLLAFIASTPSSKDFAVGSGRLAKGQPAEGFNISAQGSPLDAKGNVRLQGPLFGDLRGTVECLDVEVNQAGISGKLDNPPENNPGLTHFVIGVEDNGEPNAPTRDRAVFAPSTGPPVGTMCGLGTLLADEGEAIVQGNIVVKDRGP